MSPLTLAQSYLIKARARLKALDVLLGEKAHSDVVREAQEVVELARESHAVVLAAREVILLPAPPRPPEDESRPAEEAAREGEA